MIILGQKVRDTISGLEGTTVARINYLSGCVQFCVQPRVDKDGKYPEHHYIDVGQLKALDEEDCDPAQERSSKDTNPEALDPPGGDSPYCPE